VSTYCSLQLPSDHYKPLSLSKYHHWTLPSSCIFHAVDIADPQHLIQRPRGHIFSCHHYQFTASERLHFHEAIFSSFELLSKKIFPDTKSVQNLVKFE
jgi:hypothetical protein